jgi:pimeloyl-ACP methyl ester carboxylesterase
MPARPSIVFTHGLWADGSCYSKVIPALEADGHQVVSAQNRLDTLEGDVATVTRALGRVSSPAILVGHSYAGTVITATGTDDGVAGLVHIAALAPDADASWYVVANNDQTVNPEPERFVANRMGAHTYGVDSSHVPILSHPSFVLDVILDAAKAV